MARLGLGLLASLVEQIQVVDASQPYPLASFGYARTSEAEEACPHAIGRSTLDFLRVHVAESLRLRNSHKELFSQRCRDLYAQL